MRTQTGRVRYILPKDVHTLFSLPEGKTTKIGNLHDSGDPRSPTFCNITEHVKNSHGEVRYKIRISLADGEIKEGWTPGGGLNPVLHDPDEELLDGRFNL